MFVLDDEGALGQRRRRVASAQGSKQTKLKDGPLESKKVGPNFADADGKGGGHADICLGSEWMRKQS